MFKPENISGLKLTVLGAGISGVSIASFAKRSGADVFISDFAEISDVVLKSLDENGISYEQGGHTDRILRADKVVVSSGFPPRAPVLRKLASQGLTPTGELDFVLPHIKGRVIGITGSNGKTTTTSLLGHLINSGGKNCAISGNIGNPIADFAGIDFDFFALELSSFQLHWTRNVKLAGAIVTNLAPDHIDWHGSYDNYIADKARIINFLDEDGFAIIQSRDKELLKANGRGVRTISWDDLDTKSDILLSSTERIALMEGSELLRFDETRLLGAHNMENASMAMAAVKLSGADFVSARTALKSYEAPPHRCALVLTKDGVKYIDDSKGTNVAASRTAMSSIGGPHIVILGGRGKNEDYNGLIEPLKKFAKCAILIGEASKEIAAAFIKGGYEAFREAGDLESAVKYAVTIASPGDSVLLSPACTSWDAYKNYKERGDHFVSLVLRYAGEKNAEI
jgi:UDP-N-acetylmuramoylalanine--D-glutamate ligase